MDYLVHEAGGRGMSVVLGLVLGTLVTAVIARWRRLRERHRILGGDARDTVVIAHHLVEAGETPDGGPCPKTLRIRSLGQSELNRVVPNGHLAAVLHRRANHVTTRHTLISMEGAEGSYLLETLTNFVGDRAGGRPFGHDVYVMAPCCEPAGLVHFQPITILVIRVVDLLLFADWPACRGIAVEHGSDGARVLTLMELARRYQIEQARMAELRAAGKRTEHVETMYILDLALDTRTADVPTKPVAWTRFEAVLAGMGLE